MAFDWKSLVSKVAPTIATAIGGPLAGTAVAALGAALGLGDSATEEQVANAMQNLTPEQIVAMRQADLNFKQRMAELQIDVQRLDFEDRKSAREREASTGDTFTPRVLTFGAIGLFTLTLIGTFVLALWPNLTIQSEVAYMLGGLQSATAVLSQNCYNYYFGNNSESGIRDQMIYNAKPYSADKQKKNCQSDKPGNEYPLG